MPDLLNFGFLKRAYERSPQWVRRAYAAVPLDYRAGRVYRKTRKLIADTEFLSSGRLIELQNARLAQLLRHAATHVPYYRERLSPGGRRHVREDLLDRFQTLPLTSKQIFQERPELFRSELPGEPTFKDSTGGSTGAPFGFIKPNSMYPRELAYMFSQWERVGYGPGDRKLTLRGRPFAFRGVNERWHYNPIYNELVLSTFHLDPETIGHSLIQVRRFRPRFLHGYPSAIVTFLRTIVDHGLDLPEGIEAVLCGSEPLYDYQRLFIQNTLQARVYSWYGQSECVLLCGECEHSSEYHSFPLYGVLELVDGDGRPITTPGVEGEIVGTSLNNFAMPFIRYRTGDRGLLAPVEACACGRSYVRLTHVTGRKQYFVYARDFTPVPVTALVFGQHFRAFARMCGMQLFQDAPGELVVRIVRRCDYTEADESELRHKMASAVDGRLRVHFDYVDRLPLNSAGKTDFLVQQVKQPA